jgi:3-phytase
MLILSQYPINAAAVRTFQQFRWIDLPDAQLPTIDHDLASYYGSQARERLRLSSKSHWDVPVQVRGTSLHLLASHPTPPVFDGPEDRNGLRNQDEIRFWIEYLGSDEQRTAALYDDAKQQGGLALGTHFIIAGDLNSDPHDGDSRHAAIRSLLQHPRVLAEPVPSSEGGVEQAEKQGGVNRDHLGNPAHDTADFFDGARGSGNLRVDYVLPSRTLDVTAAGVFWPTENTAGATWIKCSDHRLVWVDLRTP